MNCIDGHSLFWCFGFGMMEGGVKICWSLHGNKEICARYEILEMVGSGGYSDVYRARRKEDGLIVALKEVHDYQSTCRELDALQRLAGCPNVVTLYEWFWREHEDAVLVLEFLPSDLSSVIKSAKKHKPEGIPAMEVKAWMIQLLQGMAACHGRSVIHRDVKPSNLLISSDGILKLADFGQARILEPDIAFVEHDKVPAKDNVIDGPANERLTEENGNTNGVLHDGNGCLSITIAAEPNNLAQMGNLISNNDEGIDGSELTCGVGTRWYRAPELLYGSTQYGEEIDLWSLGCIFGELLNLDPLFPGNSDIDQLSRMVRVLGSPTKENWPGCPYLPDYGKICFPDIHNPVGLRNHVTNCSENAFRLLERFVCYDPASRFTAVEALESIYFIEEPFPAFTDELAVPLPEKEDNSFSDDWEAWNISESDSDLEDNFNVIHSNCGYTIQF